MSTTREIDETLRRWAEAHKMDEAKVAALRETVGRRLADERFLHVPPPVAAQRWTIAAVAATAAAALVVFTLMNRRTPENAGAAQPVFADFSAKDVKARTDLFQAVGELFGTRLAWLDLSPRGLHIALAENGESTGRPMLVRVWVVRRDAGARNWQTVWHREVIARDQEMVDIRGDNGDVKELQWWAIETDDKSVVVETQMVLAGSGAHGNNTVVLRAGRTSEILSFRHEGTEYRVYQAVRRLASEDKPSTGGRTS